MNCAVIVICDSLRTDLIAQRDARSTRRSISTRCWLTPDWSGRRPHPRPSWHLMARPRALFADPAGALVGEVARFLETQDWVGRAFVGSELAEIGLPTRSAAQIALTLKPDDRTNPHGAPGHRHIVRDSLEPKDCTGLGQHGGLRIPKRL